MRKATAGVSSVVLLAVLAAVCFAVFRIDSSLRALRLQVSHEGDLAFTLAPLAVRAGPAFEPLATPNNATTGAAFAGKLYLAGPAGLAVYDRIGDHTDDRGSDSPSKLLRTGLDLPPAPIVALAEGRLRGQPSALLLAATHGEGLLLFSSDASTPVQQLRPQAADDRDITSILPLASGDLLLGTRRAGLLLYDGKTLRLFAPGFAHAPITALAGDEGDFWAGTRTQGVLHWHAGQLDTIGPGNGLPDPQVDDIAIGPEGVFVATPLGVAQFSNGHFARVIAPGLFARALALNGDALDVATIDQGLHILPLKARISSAALLTPATASGAPFVASASGAMGGESSGPLRGEWNGALDNFQLSVTHFFTVDHTLLAVAEGNLLRLGPGGDWQKILSAPPQSLADSNVTALSFGPDGRLWIGYFDRGLDVLDLQTGRAQHVEDDHVFCINRIVPDLERHTMDVATANGLVLFDAAPFAAAASDETNSAQASPRERQVLTRRDGLIADQVTDIAFSSAGMTIATPAGLTLFTASGPQSLYSFQGLANNHVYALAAEPGGSRVLAGTLGGVSILDHGTVLQNVTLRNSGLKRNWVTAIARVSLTLPQPADSAPLETPSGNQPARWFVGTYGGGVVAMDAAGHVTATDFPVPSAVINPNALLETPRRVFAGSLDNGLFVYDLASRRWSQVLSGLPSPSVTALAENNGELYIGTENGIVRIAEAGLP